MRLTKINPDYYRLEALLSAYPQADMPYHEWREAVLDAVEEIAARTAAVSRVWEATGNACPLEEILDAEPGDWDMDVARRLVRGAKQKERDEAQGLASTGVMSERNRTDSSDTALRTELDEALTGPCCSFSMPCDHRIQRIRDLFARLERERDHWKCLCEIAEASLREHGYGGDDD
ncbi:MAG: hypothetical protein AMS18_00265 [Gemmatimonas sp. SG8_17]|nr:MAG: hypothetical protein AMS18_00265 [Gemmatimonas sp. SG8_17]